jgi:hypothetical protein
VLCGVMARVDTTTSRIRSCIAVGSGLFLEGEGAGMGGGGGGVRRWCERQESEWAGVEEGRRELTKGAGSRKHGPLIVARVCSRWAGGKADASSRHTPLPAISNNMLRGVRHCSVEPGGCCAP